MSPAAQVPAYVHADQVPQQVPDGFVVVDIFVVVVAVTGDVVEVVTGVVDVLVVGDLVVVVLPAVVVACSGVVVPL